MTIVANSTNRAKDQQTGSPLEVLLAFLKLGVSSFGGPIAHIGYFREEFVVRRRWLDEQAYADLVGLCQFLPGPASCQVSFSIGLMRAGYWGGLAAWTGFTLPSAILLVTAVDWCGYTREQVLNRPFWDTPWWRGSEDMKATIRFATGQAAAGFVFRRELRYWTADGSERFVDLAMHPIRDASGAVMFLHPTGIDITESKHFEAALGESEQRLRWLASVQLRPAALGRSCCDSRGWRRCPRAPRGSEAVLCEFVGVRAESVPTIKVFKDPNCGCCGAWVEHLTTIESATKSTISKRLMSLHNSEPKRPSRRASQSRPSMPLPARPRTSRVL